MPKKALVRIEEGATVTSAATDYAELLDAGLEQQLGPASAEEEGLGSGGQLAVRTGRRLAFLRHNLEVTTEALERIQDELCRWRSKRQKAHDELYDHAKDLRKYFRALAEDGEGDVFLGMRGHLPREPKELHAKLGPVTRRLADDRWAAPEFRLKGFKFNRQETAEYVVDTHREVGEALAAIKQGTNRETVAKLARKRAAIAHADFLGKSSRFLAAALELAGLEELAATVRPGAGRRGRPLKNQLAESAALPAEPAVLPPAATAQLAAAAPAEIAETASATPPDEPEDPTEA